MSSNRFNADLRSARNRVEDSGISGIISLEHGGGHGEVLATFAHETLSDPILVRLISADPDSYPDGNNFFLSTDGEDVHAAVSSALEDLQNFTFGQTIFESLRIVASGLVRTLSQRSVDADGEIIMDGAADDNTASEDGFDEEDLEGLDLNEDEDLIFGLGSRVVQKPSASRTKTAKMAPGVLSKIRRDLRKAREAGVKIGILSGVYDEARNHMVSLSIRAQKLGISDVALEAWDVDPSDYIVLLFRIDEPYPSAEKLLERSASSFVSEFRFGKCKRFKPSPESARSAFKPQPEGATANQDNRAQATETEADSPPFSKLFISNSMEQFMNEQFLTLTKLRLTGYQSWDDANSYILNLSVSRTPSDTTEASGPVNVQGEDFSQAKEEKTGKEFASASAQSLFVDGLEQQTLPTILTWDSFAEPVKDISIPLVAMQFAMHYFVRCTEYCLRCHRRVKTEFQALKPYVCEDPLCLFQYIAMGFGPSIEHEILSQPYVVDLLVTLCYSSIQDQINAPYGLGANIGNSGVSFSTYPIGDFPTGLRLKVASLPPPTLPSPQTQFSGAQPTASIDAQNRSDLYGIPIKVSVDFDSKTFSAENPVDLRDLTEKSWVVLRQFVIGNNGQSPPGQVLVHQAYLTYIDRFSNRVQFDMKYQDSALEALFPQLTGPQALFLYKCDLELDDLDNAGKAKAMTTILATIPPISQLREYLIAHPHSRLKSCQEISPSAATLLEWIVASNRSFILQVNHVDDHHAQNRELLETIKTRNQEIIPSLSQGYIQFRFAMGNPDKELRFQRALKELEAQAENPYPTLFAWHGSPIRNWHNILRQGLDFKRVAHGRAYGDGVYFSPVFSISQSYMQQTSKSWPNSALNPVGVIALCEIINAPTKFTSSSPHYVVQQLDWIQCRYLFVKPSAPALIQSGTSEACLDTIDELPQDPKRIVRGPQDKRLKIPRKALPANRGGKAKAKATDLTPSKRSHDADTTGGDTDEEDAADIDALFSDEESPEPPRKRVQALAKRDFGSRGSSVDTITARQLTTARPLTPPKSSVVSSMTDFRPGTLDLKSIPQLGLPDWANASSSKRLASDIKLMQKVQMTTPLHELGWYIDFSNIDNMFQWIVELHTFDPELPLAKDMKKAGITSVVLEIRFGRDYPLSPPFVRVIRPMFLPFMHGGGGHVTIGGAICMEMLTSTGWTVAMSMESVLVSVKMAMSSLDPQPARLQTSSRGIGDYSAHEALEAFQRFANRHGWKVPSDTAVNATRI